MASHSKRTEEPQADPRLIIEKGGYRPDLSGHTMPPARPGVGQFGYRPTTDLPTAPPIKPVAPHGSSGNGPKK